MSSVRIVMAALNLVCMGILVSTVVVVPCSVLLAWGVKVSLGMVIEPVLLMGYGWLGLAVLWTSATIVVLVLGRIRSE